MQTDASINAGSSGGALLDSSGRLVGISTATFSKKGSVRHTLVLVLTHVTGKAPDLLVGQPSRRSVARRGEAAASTLLCQQTW